MGGHMPDRLQTYRNRVSDAVDAWYDNVCSPYVIAYNTAYHSYKDTFSKQKDSDKARAELFVSIAALLPGSILMATAATSSFRAVANRAALRLLAERSANRTLAVYNAVSTNATATFAIGKAIDLVKDEAVKKVKDAVAEAMSMTKDVLSVDPFNRDKQLHSWLTNHKLLAYDTASAIEDSHAMSPAAKEQTYAQLRAAPIANRPAAKIVTARLSLKIELGFYMIWLLESDQLVTEVAPAGPNGFGGRYSSNPIPQMPSSKEYPRGNTDRSRGPIRWVGVTRPGGEVEDRIDTLTKALTGQNFYETSGWFGKSDANQARLKEVAKAERVLSMLSNATQPLAPLGVRD